MKRNTKAHRLIKKLGLLLSAMAVGFVWSASSATAGDPCGETCCDTGKVFKNKCSSCFSGRLSKRWCKKKCGDSCTEGCAETSPESCCPDSCGLDGCGLGCGSSCLGGSLGEPFKLFDFGNDSSLNMGGWMQFGYTSESTTLFNNQPDRINTHQIWLFAEEVADGSDGVGFGFRIDAMYGTDAADTQSFGNDRGEWDFLHGYDRGAGYGFAMPQLYGEVAYENVSVKVGHFYTLLGYEVVTAPDNFFYSHAFTMYNSEAFTHTGALATIDMGDDTEVYAGWTLGWDTGFDQFSNGNSFLGGAKFSVSDDATLTYILTAGNLGAIGVGHSHSLVFDVNVSDKLNLVSQIDLRDTAGNFHKGVTAAETETIGFNQYIFYELDEKVKVGTRLEWWKVNGTSVAAATFGVNVRPTANLVIRPEIRYQHASKPGFVSANALENEETIFGIDAILTF